MTLRRTASMRVLTCVSMRYEITPVHYSRDDSGSIHRQVCGMQDACSELTTIWRCKRRSDGSESIAEMMERLNDVIEREGWVVEDEMIVR